MKIRARIALKILGAAALLLLAAGVAAPYLSADRYGERLRASLERALGGNRRVEIGKVHFNLFKGPGFSVDSVTIHEDPAIGAEPVVYILPDSGSLEVTPSLWSLLGGRFVISSIRLEGASINLSKSGPASQWGRWNFASFVDRSIMSSAPAIHVRNSRINFKFGDTKSVFYLTEADLDITPPSAGGAGWSVRCSAQPARTDRPGQGLASFTLRGRWYVAPERVDLDLALDRVGLGQITELVRGQAGGVHGTLSARLHLAGPLDNVGISGRLTVEDVHRWDMLPTEGKGWPLDIGGRLDLLTQRLEIQSNSASGAPLPLTLRFQAADYLSQPRWSAAMYWNRFPIEPIMELARHMGAQFSPGLKLSGTMDGELDYVAQAGFQGQVAFHGAALTIPGSPPVGFEQARLTIDKGHVRLSPAVVRTSDGEKASLQADYDMGAASLDLAISADAMKVVSLRAQVALAAVPWLEQVASGSWTGLLRYHADPAAAGWTGRLQLAGAEIPVPGLADPFRLNAARVRIEGARVTLDRLDAHVGKLAFTGEYSYEPGAARPHRLRLVASQADAADLETELLPTLRRAGLLARALGRASIPDWLKERSVDGTVRIDDLELAGAHWENLRARMLWDGARVQFTGIQANLGRTAVSGGLSMSLRGARPSYKLAAKVQGLAWQAGKVDAEGILETSGSGADLLSNLTSKGSFTVAGADLGLTSLCRAAAGGYSLEWWQDAPRLQLSDLTVRTEDGSYTGRGATQEGGRLVILLNGGGKEMRISGTVGKLKLEEGNR
ncbi:MAG: hypothetical protein ABSC23_00340 [Bryobacteraceae bacterium]|jgi:hypothetical protein